MSVAAASRPDPHVLVIFGARGDLARRKLLPALFQLTRVGLMPEEYRIIGSGRHAPDGGFAAEVREALEAHADVDPAGEDWDAFAGRLSFVVSSAEDGQELAAAVAGARKELGESSRTLLYMAVPPSAMQPIVATLGDAGLLDDRARIVMEKPFGSDLASATQLNAELHRYANEDQIFRIDHFLGKEAAQDILALRFANGLFEPIWHRGHIASVQIDIPEKLGLEGRASFYEETGAFRDMVVTHLSQLLGFVAMEPPRSLDADALRDAKAAVFGDLRPFDPEQAVFAQYEGYRDEEGVAEDSSTETFVALRAQIENDRWRGVPFLLRTGKQMAATRRVISIALHRPKHLIFDEAHEHERPDEIVFELTEDPRITVEMRVKVPGPTLQITRAPLSLDVERALEVHGLEAYERLLHDVMLGDQLLFARADEIERLWECAAPLLEHHPEPLSYAKGSWGPEGSLELAAPVGWRLPEDA
jgi:glucose-6-phosphate 1-dehydrogenase